MLKKLTSLFLVYVMLSVLLCGCAKKSEKPSEYIGIISAMDNEINLLLKEAVIDRVDTVADVEYHVGSLHGQAVVIMRAGIGKIRAASGVTTLLNKYPISKVIFTGIAGGVADETKSLLPALLNTTMAFFQTADLNGVREILASAANRAFTTIAIRSLYSLHTMRLSKSWGRITYLKELLQPVTSL